MEAIWEPYGEYIARQYFIKIAERRVWTQMLWGVELDKEQVWEIAQQEYEHFKTELPASHLAYYLP